MDFACFDQVIHRAQLENHSPLVSWLMLFVDLSVHCRVSVLCVLPAFPGSAIPAFHADPTDTVRFCSRLNDRIGGDSWLVLPSHHWLPLTVCAPYLYHMSQTIKQTSGRGGDDFTHATMYPFDFQDTLESLVYPLAARPEGWFYFGALALTVIVLYLARPQHDSSSEDAAISERRTWPIKAALAGWLIFLSYLSYGEQSYLFLLFYKILPSFSALRGWGRLSITLLPGLALLFAYALADFESRLDDVKPGRTIKSHTWIPLTVLALFSLGFQFYEFSRGMVDEYWSLYFIRRASFLIQTTANVFGRNIEPDLVKLSAGYSISYMAFSLLAVLIVLFLISRNRHIFI